MGIGIGWVVDIAIGVVVVAVVVVIVVVGGVVVVAGVEFIVTLEQSFFVPFTMQIVSDDTAAGGPTCMSTV